MLRLTAAAMVAISASGEQVNFDESLTYAEKVNILKYSDVNAFHPKPKPENKILSFVSQEKRMSETKEGGLRTDPWVQGWKAFRWLANYDLFKMATGADADLIAYGELK